jgi:hypothetical protein
MHKAQQVQRRADHRDIEGAGVRAGDVGPVWQARHQQCDLLQVEGQVWRPRRVGRTASEDAGGREHPAQKLLAEAMLDDAILKDVASTNV